MTFNIEDFKASLNKHNGLAGNNLFVARVSLPASLTNYDMPDGDLIFFCRSADVPGLNLQTMDIHNQGFGALERRPTSLPPEQLSTIFMVDGNFKVKEMFHKWLQLIVNYNNENNYAEHDGKLPYEMGYKDDYVGQVEITIFSSDGKTAYRYLYRNAFPINIGNVSVAWENSAEIMTLPVGFSYDSYKMTGTLDGTLTNPIARSGGVISYESALSAYGINLNALGEFNGLQDMTNKIYNLL